MGMAARPPAVRSPTRGRGLRGVPRCQIPDRVPQQPLTGRNTNDCVWNYQKRRCGVASRPPTRRGLALSLEDDAR